MDRAELETRYGAAACAAARQFGLERPNPQLVTVAENVTFRVDDAEGESYVLRLHRPGYHNLAELESERTWTAALTRVGVEVPRGATTPDGRHYVEVEALDGERRYAGLTHWIKGTPLSVALKDAEPEACAPYFARIGEIAAAIHNQSSGWRPPEGFTRHAFDVAGFFGTTPFWGPFWESSTLTRSERRLLIDTRDAIRQVLSEYGNDERTYSLIHADLHFSNVLIDGERLAVIDFDDAGFGWHHYELAVILYGHPSDRYTANLTALLDGYRRVRPFPDNDAALVRLFVMIRGPRHPRMVRATPGAIRS